MPHGQPCIDYQTWRRLLRGERLPCAAVDLDAFDRNVASFAKFADDAPHQPTIRLATKSIRVPILIQRALDFGSPYKGLMCYAASEAAFLAELGFDDLLVAYPTVHREDLASLREIHSRGKTIRLVLDSEQQLKCVSAAMAGVATPFPIVLDIDMSLRPLGDRAHFGVRRSPLRNVKDVLKLCETAESLNGVRIVGLMGYEAQVAGLCDANPFQKLALRPLIRSIRRRSIGHVAKFRRELAAAMRARGFALELFNGGGTGSVNYSSRESVLTEVTVGSGLLCSHLFDYFSNVEPEPACFFALQVTRSSDAEFVTCAGGGYIASGGAGRDKSPLPYLPGGLRLVGAEGCGEVQTPLRLPPDVELHPGDPVLFRHAKAGELAEHFQEYLLISQGRIVDRSPTYRGLGQCFL